jgi:hypothetical protein
VVWRLGQLTTASSRRTPSGQEVHRRLRQGRGLCAQQAGRGTPVPEGLHRHRRPADQRSAAGRLHDVQRVHAGDVAHFQKFFDLFSEKGIFRSGCWSTPCSTRAEPWTATTDRQLRSRRTAGGPGPGRRPPPCRRCHIPQKPLGQAAALHRPGAAVHHLGPGGALRLHQGHPAAQPGDTVRAGQGWRAARC